MAGLSPPEQPEIPDGSKTIQALDQSNTMGWIRRKADELDANVILGAVFVLVLATIIAWGARRRR